MQDKLLDYLLKKRLITPEEAEGLRKDLAESRRSLRDLLLERNLVSEERLLEAFSALSRMPVVRLYEHPVPPEIRKLIPAEVLRNFIIFPFAFDPQDSSTLYVAVSDPMNAKGRDTAAIVSKCRVRTYLATATEILSSIDRYYGVNEIQEAAELYASTDENDTTLEDAVIREDINSSPVVMLVNALVETAVHQRASDIHVEAHIDRIRVRCRVDGVLNTTATYDRRLLPAIIARIKILRGLDISERRKPQDGHFTARVDRREYDVRVSTMPTFYGEKCVMRLNQKSAFTRGKEALGFSPEDLRQFNRILRSPNGIVLVTGPTGSGKSTTLYAALSELNSEAVNIVTVEDPVEANIDGVNQVQVNTKAGVSFNSILRSILRQDPDIIMIGEIRDAETASIAVQASITGHLVVSTLHTNDTASSVTRLLDMGIESYLIADSVTGIIAQRLLRRLCPGCKRSRPPTADEAAYLRLSPEEREGAAVWESTGCQRCGGTGYFHRIGIYEIMEMTPKLRSMVSRRATAEELREAALQNGMRTLRQSARNLVLGGVTSLAEMKRITAEDYDSAAEPEKKERNDP